MQGVLLDAFARTELVGAIVSEELDEPRQIAGGPEASYVLCVDPLSAVVAGRGQQEAGSRQGEQEAGSGKQEAEDQ